MIGFGKLQQCPRRCRESRYAGEIRPPELGGFGITDLVECRDTGPTTDLTLSYNVAR
jgi:hypothetical protein